MKKLSPQQSLDDLTEEYMIFVGTLVNAGIWNPLIKQAATRFKDAAFRHGNQMRAFGYLDAKAEEIERIKNKIEQ